MLGENVPAYNQRSQAFFCNGDYASCDPRRTIFPPIRGPIGGTFELFRSLHPCGAHFCYLAATGSQRGLPSGRYRVTGLIGR